MTCFQVTGCLEERGTVAQTCHGQIVCTWEQMFGIECWRQSILPSLGKLRGEEITAIKVHLFTSQNMTSELCMIAMWLRVL